MGVIRSNPGGKFIKNKTGWHHRRSKNRSKSAGKAHEVARSYQGGRREVVMAAGGAKAAEESSPAMSRNR